MKSSLCNFYLSVLWSTQNKSNPFYTHKSFRYLKNVMSPSINSLIYAIFPRFSRDMISKPFAILDSINWYLLFSISALKIGCSILFLVLLYVTVHVTEWKKYTLSQKQLCVSHRYVKNVTHTAVSTQVHFLHSLKKYWHEKSPQQKKWSSKQKKLKWSTFKCIYVHPELVGLIYLVWYRLYC